jgi:predicted transcriptional regulator of viral defense system
MPENDRIKQIFDGYGGIASTSELKSSGLYPVQLGRLVRDGTLFRLRQGYYQMSEDDSIPEALYLIKLLPEAIVCMESALYNYNYIDFLPRAWSIAVPRTISLSKLKLDVLTLNPYFIQSAFYELGKVTTKIDEVELPIYNRERCICDCFKYRYKIDSELFNKAVNAYSKDPHKNIPRLSEYAHRMQLADVIHNIMGVILNV